MSWDDFRFVLALHRAGSLLRAAKLLGVDHTTVGRRVAVAERALGVRLFARTTSGYVPTADADRLLAAMQRVEEAVSAVERGAAAGVGALLGAVRVTSPETLGVAYLSGRLAAFGLAHRGLVIELVPGGELLDLGRREAEVAIRPFRSREASLVVRRVAEVSYGCYASSEYLARRPVRSAQQLDAHPILMGSTGSDELESRWLRRLAPRARAVFVSPLSLALVGAARAGAGVAILPRYLGDPEPTLRHIALPDEPKEALWLTVHRDLKDSPRVRTLLDFLAATMKDDAALFRGRAR